MNQRGRIWGLETTPEFDRTARKLDRQVLKRIKTYLDEVCGLADPRGIDHHRRRCTRTPVQRLLTPAHANSAGTPGYSGGVPLKAGHIVWKEHQPHNFEVFGAKLPDRASSPICDQIRPRSFST